MEVDYQGACPKNTSFWGCGETWEKEGGEEVVSQCVHSSLKLVVLSRHTSCWREHLVANPISPASNLGREGELTTPALFTSTSNLPSLLKNSLAAPLIVDKSARSMAINSNLPVESGNNALVAAMETEAFWELRPRM